MQYLLPLFLLTFVLACNAAVVPDVPSQDFSVGTIRPGDRLLHEGSFQITFLDRFMYHDYGISNQNIKEISAVFATEVDKTPFAGAWIVDGGVGFNYVRIRIQAVYPFGANYAFKIWGN